MNDPGQIVILDLSVLHPRREVPHFPVVPVVREPHLRPDVYNLVAVDDDSAVVDDVLVDDRPAMI